MGKRKNPETSNAAYKSLDPENLNERYTLILEALGKIKEGTFEQIAKAAGLQDKVVWKRLSELAASKLIYRPGNKRKLKSGREGYTWMLTGDVAEKMQNRERALGGKAVSDYSKDITTIVRQHTRKTSKNQEPVNTNKLF
jgi:predicted ArsR family transcriptional regulator